MAAILGRLAAGRMDPFREFRRLTKIRKCVPIQQLGCTILVKPNSGANPSGGNIVSNCKNYAYPAAPESSFVARSLLGP